MLQFTGLYKATIALGKNQRIESERFTFAPNGEKSTPNGRSPHFIPFCQVLRQHLLEPISHLL
jgi:hypothetical protein